MHQISPVFNEAELRRLQRYGTVCRYADGATLFEAGSSSFGMLVILCGPRRRHAPRRTGPHRR